MKKFLNFKHTKICCMSYPKKKSLELLDRHSKLLNDHVIKCVVYKDSPSRNHWMGEIATWLESANRVSCKSKLKSSDYEDTIFGYFGTDVDDAEFNLDNFYEDYVKYAHEPYPEFKISPKLVNDLYSVYESLKSVTIPYMLKGERVSTSKWLHIISYIFN